MTPPRLLVGTCEFALRHTRAFAQAVRFVGVGATIAVALVGICAPIALAQRADLKGAEGRIGVTAQGLRVLTGIEGRSPTSADVTAGGIDFLVWMPAKRLGAQLSFLSGAAPPNSGRFSSFAITGLYGSSRLAGELGLSRRAAYSDDSQRDLDQGFSVLRIGGRGATELGTTPFALGLRGALSAPFGLEFDKGASGFDLETEIRWQPVSTRVSASLGYRFERLDVEKAEQEVGYVTLGLAYRFGVHRP